MTVSPKYHSTSSLDRPRRMDSPLKTGRRPGMRWNPYLLFVSLILTLALGCTGRERGGRGSGENPNLPIGGETDGGDERNSSGDASIVRDSSFSQDDASAQPTSETSCSNGVDDDGDFAVDCDDSDCIGDFSCQQEPTEETSCTNGVDDDGDFDIDCDDSDCNFDSACQAVDNRTRSCGARPPAVAASTATPFCSSQTFDCLQACTDEVCAANCVNADATPPQTIDGQTVDCAGCMNLEFYHCAYGAGCDVSWADFGCCVEDEGCTTDSCAQSACGTQAATLNQCLISAVTACDNSSAGCFN